MPKKAGAHKTKATSIDKPDGLGKTNVVFGSIVNLSRLAGENSGLQATAKRNLKTTNNKNDADMFGQLLSPETRERLRDVLRSEGIEREACVNQLMQVIAREKMRRSTTPMWEDRARYADLFRLTAPLFLKLVYASLLDSSESIDKETIRTLDPALMVAVEQYISQRESRARKRGVPCDLGDATGLHFETNRPAPNRYKAPKEGKGPSLS